MANHVTGSVSYYLAIRREHVDDLAQIRHWPNLKVGYEEDMLWIKDLDYAQAHSVSVRSIPFKTIYFEEKGRLVLLNHLLPERTVPSLLWTPIDRALTVKRPELNHHFFGINERLSVKLIATEEETEGIAVVVPLLYLQDYIITAPLMRLQNLRWCVLGKERALLMGKPLLPLPGKVYWQRKDFLLPAGYDFDLPLLTDVLHKRINPGRDRWVLWDKEDEYSFIEKASMIGLSRSSFRQTMDSLNRMLK